MVRRQQPRCGLHANRIRATFTTPEKNDYVKAVQCISKLPPKTPKSECPGCKNRYGKL